MATYRSLFRVREFRFLYAGYALSYGGDQLSSIAVAVLVFDRTESGLLTSVAFASAFLPSALGPWLGTIADRIPRRQVMIGCDLARAALVAMLAVPGLPIWQAMVLLYLTHLFTPAFTAARAATMPEVLSGEAYILGNGLTNITHQLSQVGGFAIGGATVALITPAGTLLVNAATFALSAVLIWSGVRRRPAAAAGAAGRRSVLSDAFGGLRYVFSDQWLRGCLLLVWIVPALAFAPGAIAYPYARELGGGPPLTGMFLASGALGLATGSLLLTRFAGQRLRTRLLIPQAAMAGACLVPLLTHPPAPLVALALFGCGLGCAFAVPLNAEFVLRVAPEFRGRAMGVAVGGIAAGQGLGFLSAGWILEAGTAASTTAGLFGIAATTAAVVFGLALPGLRGPTARHRDSHRGPQRAAGPPGRTNPGR